ncbi:hypothetical protein EDD15DRAFT_2364887 [Pisolithus albus]|nr:hypothetical protein EDD15DRAFT_2364887 [Pisolithus albus]
MDPSPPAPPAIYGLFTPLDALYTEVQDTCHWEARMTCREFPPSSKCFVEKVTIHKSHSLDGHEFLRFEIRAPDDNPHRAIVVVGRRVHISSAADSSTLCLTSSGWRASPLPSALPARDQVRAATMGTERGDELMDNSSSCPISSLTFPERAPSADELSTLLGAISGHCKDYRLLTSQCYWYARTAFKALSQLFKAHEHPVDGNNEINTIFGSKLPSGEDLDAVCRIYQNKREALFKDPRRASEARDNEVQRLVLALRAKETEHEQTVLALRAKESEQEQTVLALRAMESEREHALLTSQAWKGECEQLRKEMHLLKNQVKSREQADRRD